LPSKTAKFYLRDADKKVFRNYKRHNLSEADRDNKLKKILNAIVRMAAGDYKIDLPFSESDDPLDWIASGLNMLAGELKSTVVSRDHFNAIVRSMPDSLIVLDKLGYVELANEASEKLLGLNKSLLGGLHFSRICPGFYQKSSDVNGELSAHGIDEPIEVDYIGKNGKCIPVLFSASALSEGSPRGRGWICAAQDLRSRKQLEVSLRQKDTLLANSSKLAALGEMAAGIAHEINNPIAIIAGRADQIKEMAKSGTLDAPQILKMADRIDSTARRVSKIIAGLRTLARDADQDAFALTSVAQVVEDAVSLCGERFKNSGVNLVVDSVDPELQFECRAVQIAQVLLNLLNNAFDATLGEQDKWVRVCCTANGENVYISVIDSGPGIPAELRSKIMQPFFTTKEPGKGTGLGLSIASGILTAHSGSLHLEDSGHPTRFTIHLPRKSQAKVA
jgi:PAS domain S-box-containing protein